MRRPLRRGVIATTSRPPAAPVFPHASDPFPEGIPAVGIDGILPSRLLVSLALLRRCAAASGQAYREG
jgi:hypothetical protein